jgi:hypothetical protein
MLKRALKRENAEESRHNTPLSPFRLCKHVVWKQRDTYYPQTVAEACHRPKQMRMTVHHIVTWRDPNRYKFNAHAVTKLH